MNAWFSLVFVAGLVMFLQAMEFSIIEAIRKNSETGQEKNPAESSGDKPTSGPTASDACDRS
jgi:hypothetical protein